jgi:hypothetical protein
MGNIDYKRFGRVLGRCNEIATAKGAKPTIVRVYNDVLKKSADDYLAAQKAMVAAESAAGKETKEASTALADIDRPYREARAVTLAFIPTLKVPDTLKRQATDTDKVNGIEDLLDAIDDHTGAAWADELLTGNFGLKAPAVVKEINEAIAANKDLANAREARAQSFGPAYEKYLAFKRVVREAEGPQSKEYKRIHLAAPVGGAGDEDEDEGQGGPSGGTTG